MNGNQVLAGAGPRLLGGGFRMAKLAAALGGGRHSLLAEGSPCGLGGGWRGVGRLAGAAGVAAASTPPPRKISSC